MRLDIYVHSMPGLDDGDVGNKLDLIIRMLGIIARRETAIMARIDDVLAEATRGTTVADSVLVLVQTLIDQAGGDPVKLQAALDLLKADHDRVEAAVLANTPQV